MDFTKKEAAERFEAALRGARLAEQKPMKSINKKRPSPPLTKQTGKKSPR